jgi:radical SAM protein with 4Fe4S-binding SPASM domain
VSGRIYVEPSVVVVLPSVGDVRVAEVGAGRELVATGRVADELRGFFATGARGPVLRALGEAHPIARVAESLAGQPWVPLERSSALTLDGLYTLFLELTGQCNERCVHCYADAGPEVSSALARPVVERVLAEARALGFDHVQFTGGDPLICAFLPELVERATALGFGSREIYTNGLLLSDALLDRLAPSAPSLAFSFYSHDPDTHDRITRTPGSQVRTARAIRRAVDRGFRVRVSILIMKENAGDLGATIAFVRALGVENVGGGGTVAVGRGEVFEADRSSLNDDADLAAGDGHRPRAESREGKLCVTSDGAVVPCIFNREERLGDVHAQSLAEILARPARRPRALRVQGDERELSCPSCRVTRYALAACERE